MVIIVYCLAFYSTQSGQIIPFLQSHLHFRGERKLEFSYENVENLKGPKTLCILKLEKHEKL